jgi:membrane protein YqaA with SNARE-associated domain
MKMSDKLHARIKAYSEKLEQYADRFWYPPLLALLAALDNLIIVIPNDGLLIASSMLIPKRWAIFAISVSIGSTIGALTLSAID